MTTITSPLQPAIIAPKSKRRQSLVEFYQNDAPRRSISGSSVHSKDGNEKWEWEDILAMSKNHDKGEEFLTISRYDESNSNLPPQINVLVAPCHSH